MNSGAKMKIIKEKVMKKVFCLMGIYMHSNNIIRKSIG